MEQGSNGFAAADRWVKEIEKHKEAKLSIMMKAVSDCGPIETLIKDAKTAAKNEGIPLKLLNAALKERDLLRKVVKNRDELDEDQTEDFDELISSLTPLADLPLFGHAVDEAEGKAKKKAVKAKARSDAIDSLGAGFVGDGFGPDPQQDQTAANVIAIEKGIKPLKH